MNAGWLVNLFAFPGFWLIFCFPWLNTRHKGTSYEGWNFQMCCCCCYANSWLTKSCRALNATNIKTWNIFVENLDLLLLCLLLVCKAKRLILQPSSCAPVSSRVWSLYLGARELAFASWWLNKSSNSKILHKILLLTLLIVTVCTQTIRHGTSRLRVKSHRWRKRSGFLATEKKKPPKFTFCFVISLSISWIWLQCLTVSNQQYLLLQFFKYKLK